MRSCGCKTEVYSRVVGYYRPVTQWNKGKQEEFRCRKVYDCRTNFAEPTQGAPSCTAEPMAAEMPVSVVGA